MFRATSNGRISDNTSGGVDRRPDNGARWLGSRSPPYGEGSREFWDASPGASKPLRWYPSHISPDTQIRHSNSASNFRNLETIDEVMSSPSKSGAQRARERISNTSAYAGGSPRGGYNNQSSDKLNSQQRRHSEGDLLDVSSPNRYNKRPQAVNINGNKRAGAQVNDRLEAPRQARRKSYNGPEISPDYDDSSEAGDIHSLKSGKSRLSLGSEDSITSASRLAVRRRTETDGIDYGKLSKVSSVTSLVRNEARRKSVAGNEVLQNADKRSSVSNGVESPKGPTGKRMSALTLGGEDPSPFDTLEIPVELFDSPTSRVRKLVTPIVISLIVFILLASLAVAVYFAAVLKDSQDKQIEFLQVTLKFALAQNQEPRDFSRLTSMEQDGLKQAYCKQVDDMYKASSLKTNYRGCQVDAITNERIEFKLYFLDSPDSGKREDSILEVLAARASQVGQEGSELRKINDITFDMSEKSRSIIIEKTKKPEDFYSSSASNFTHTNPPMEASSNFVKHEAINKVSATTAYSAISTTSASNPTTTTSSTITSIRTTVTSAIISSTATLLPQNVANAVLNDSICATLDPTEIVAYPADCTHYIQCEFMKPIVRPCSGGLVFNPAVSACVKPAPDLPCTTMKPCDNINGGYFTHPTSCKLYVICDGGRTVIQSCQNNFAWDDVSKTCVPVLNGTACTLP